MSQQFDSGYRTFTAGEAITQYDLVYLSAANTVSVNDIANQPIGVAQEAAASGALVKVKLMNAPGTFKVRAKEALSAGALLYTEDGGEVQDTAAATSFPIMRAIEAATAEDDVIEALPFHFGGVAAT